MPSLPIPVFSALVLTFLFLRLCLGQRRLSPLSLLLAICAVQSLIIAMAQHYLVPNMHLLQPVTATLIPPFAWFTFQTTAVRSARATDLLHLLAPASTLAALLVAPPFLDVLIPGLFVVYGGSILLHALRGPDAQPRMSLESGDIPSRIWIAIGVALIASAFTDVLIVGAEWAGYTALRPWIISVYSVGSLFLIGALSLSDHLQVRSDEEQIIDPEQTESDARILEKLNHHMTQAKPYLDPDLTLIKLARKLGIPSKTLSAAVNRATGENMSRYVNNARIRAAQEALKAGENVTGAMLTSGFNTKSNFNREFLRVAGMSPKKWSEANP